MENPVYGQTDPANGKQRMLLMAVSIYVSVCLSVCMSVCLSANQSINPLGDEYYCSKINKACIYIYHMNVVIQCKIVLFKKENDNIQKILAQNILIDEVGFAKAVVA